MLANRTSLLGRRPAGVSFASPLAFEGVGHAYGEIVTLRDVSLTARAGEILCLLGPSGSGKTTLLRIAAGLERGHSGRVLLGDRELAAPGLFVPPERRGIAYMFQDFALFPHMTLMENVAFGLASLSRQDARRASAAALERVGLAHLGSRYPDMLSGGQQQRVALARALAPRPGVVLMDEPFSGLDARLRDETRADTLRILRETRATAIVVTHDPNEAMRMGDRIALLRDGVIAQTGTARELYHAPVDLFTARFFSDINVLQAKGRGEVVECALGAVPVSGRAEGALALAVRPTSFEFDPDGPVFPKIVARRFVGEIEAFTLTLDGHGEPLRVLLREGMVPSEASRVGLRVREGEAMVFESSDASA